MWFRVYMDEKVYVIQGNSREEVMMKLQYIFPYRVIPKKIEVDRVYTETTLQPVSVFGNQFS